ncbi:MAG: hypothetical protein JWO08_1020, partial [Verrucomicrobiaceae bacterium]|nr:hypothetical protein [Verrucomicrobiaceae bacterium]
MKITHLKSTALLALASFTLLTTAARAAHEGDLFLGVRATSGVGSNKDYLVNIGPASQFETGSSVTTLNLGDIGADLSFLFGSVATTPWYNRAEVQWGIAGATGFNDLGSIPGKTLYATSVSSTPWERKSGTAQGGTTTLISSMTTAFDDGSTIGLVAPTAKSQDSTSINSWVSYTSDGPNSGNAHIAFGAFNPSIEAAFGNGAASSVLNLYQIRPATGGSPAGTPGDLLGRLFLNNSGQLTFVPAAAIGAGTVAFTATAPTVAENAGPLVVTLTRTGDPTFAATVELSTADDTALAGTDYTGLTSQLVSFGVGETQKTVNVAITNRNGAASDRSFALHLANPSAGLSAGSDATVTITAQITPSVIQFGSATFTAHEVDNTVDVTLTRTGGTSPVDVQISTANGTALAGTDYTTVNNATVSFSLNATIATKTITLSHPVGNTTNKSFTVSLANPSTNASVGTPPTATVTILA